jgi:hypothetical protein
MVVDNLIHDPARQANSGSFDLIQGGFVFIAGQVAGTGGMGVIAPSTTMGFHRTTVVVEFVTQGGVATAQITLVRDPDGSVGRVELFDLSQNLIATITEANASWIIWTAEGETREVDREHGLRRGHLPPDRPLPPTVRPSGGWDRAGALSSSTTCCASEGTYRILVEGPASSGSVLNGGTGRDTVEIGFGGDVNTRRFPTSSTCAGSRSSTCGTARSTACGLRCPTCSACPTKASPCSGSFRR